MAQHSNYWSNSAFADWLRGTPKPAAETSTGWDNWNRAAQQAHAFRYWLAEEGLDYLQDFVTWPVRKIYDIKYYINNRWVTRTHALTAHPSDIPRGEWRDVGNRFLPCLFNELRDFVEVELAWWHLAWEGREERAKYNMPWWAVGWWRVRVWRCPQAGLDNLAWQSRLVMDESWGVSPRSKDYGKPTPQSKNAQEILDLYTWWTQTRPARPDPYEASGWSDICERRRRANGGSLSFDQTRDPTLKKMEDQSLKKLHKMEEEFETEDEEMMIRLIKIRGSLWT
jgi:hypothetical protein